MDKVYNIHNRKWISQKINLEEYFNKIISAVPAPPSFVNKEGTFGEEYTFMEPLLDRELNIPEYRQLTEYCSINKLKVTGEPEVLDIATVKIKRGLYEMAEAPEDCKLETIKHLNGPFRKAEHLKYTNTIWCSLTTYDAARELATRKSDVEPDLETHEDIVLVVRIYHPFRYTSKGRSARPIHCTHEFLVLGSQTLDKLRDKILCTEDFATGGDVSKNPVKKSGPLAKDIYKSGFIFMEDVFYNDTRESENHDNSEVIRDWAKKRKLADFKTATMESVKFKDLTIRFGYPYVYQHQGKCEHLIIFSDARLLHDRDKKTSESYPMFSSIGNKYARNCMICLHLMARWITIESDRIPVSPCYFCDACFKSYNYKGDEKIGNFRAYSYRDSHVL